MGVTSLFCVNSTGRTHYTISIKRRPCNRTIVTRAVLYEPQRADGQVAVLFFSYPTRYKMCKVQYGAYIYGRGKWFICIGTVVILPLKTPALTYNTSTIYTYISCFDSRISIYQFLIIIFLCMMTYFENHRMKKFLIRLFDKKQGSSIISHHTAQILV